MAGVKQTGAEQQKAERMVRNRESRLREAMNNVLVEAISNEVFLHGKHAKV